LRVIRGNPSKRPLNPNEPIPVGDLSDPPDWMSETQRSGWNYAIEHAPAGLLRKLDRSVLTVWVTAEDLHRRAVEQVDKFGILTKAPHTGQPIQSPYLAVVNKQAALMMKAAAELGFTPVARSRIQLIDAVAGGVDDEWDRLDRMRHADSS
jgi:P27 family predicted phage terminase small subunit